MADSIYIALDIGGTKLMAAAIDRDRRILARTKVATPHNLSLCLNTLKEMIREVANGYSIKAIGAAAGGPLDYLKGTVSALHFPEWQDVPLKDIMQQEFSCPFSVDVDTNAAALAEYYLANHQAEKLLYVTISTGMGGGLIIAGEVYRGANGSHPEVGHQSTVFCVPGKTPIECPCGALNCLEAVVSGTAIKKLYGKTAENLNNDEWKEVGSNLGQGLRNMAVTYAPDCIVMGGGVVIGGGDRLLDAARAVVDSNVKIVPRPQIVVSKLGYDTALWGAYVLATRAV